MTMQHLSLISYRCSRIGIICVQSVRISPILKPACFENVLSVDRRDYSVTTKKPRENDVRININDLLNDQDYNTATRQHQSAKEQPDVDLSSTRGITVKHINKPSPNSALMRHFLEQQPDKEGFAKAVDMWISKNKTRSGHMDFIATAMKFVEPYGLEKEVEIYEKLFDIFPRNRFDNRTLFDALWPKSHPQIHLALDVLTMMEFAGVHPSNELHDIAKEVFGRASLPLKKIYRLDFWFHEVANLNPYSLPDDVYKDRVLLLKAAVDRILGNNDGTQIVELSAPIKKEKTSIDYNHFIISSQTRTQREYVELLCDDSKPLYVEGPVDIWMNHQREQFFVLKTGSGDIKTFEWTKVDEDEEREGAVLAICFATEPFKESLQRWLLHLQQTNARLKDFRVVFNLTEDGSVAEEETIAISSS